MTRLITEAGIQDDLERAIREIGQIPPGDRMFSRDTELFDSGYLDSLGIVSLTAYIEQEYEVSLTDDQLFDPRFTTIAGISKIITTAAAGGQ